MQALGPVLFFLVRIWGRPLTGHDYACPGTVLAASFLVSAKPIALFVRRAQTRSKRSRFITLVHAATKSFTNFSLESAHA
jgi:hypothetical protein